MCDSSTRPAFIAVPNTARVDLRYTLFGQQVESVFYFEQSGAYTLTDLQDLVAALDTNWSAYFGPIVGSDLFLYEFVATALDANPGIQYIAPVSLNGGVNEPSMPGGTTIAVAFKSGLTGRSQNGRMFWLQLLPSQCVEDQVTPTAHDDILLAVTGFFTNNGIGSRWLHVIVSYCKQGAWRTTGQTTNVVSYVMVNNDIDSQRRRLAGRGR